MLCSRSTVSTCNVLNGGLYTNVQIPLNREDRKEQEAGLRREREGRPPDLNFIYLTSST